MNMNTDKIIDNLRLALTMVQEKCFNPFTAEEENEMRSFLEAQRTPTNGQHVWVHGDEPMWGVGDILAYFECSTDHEGEYFIGKITNVEFLEEYQDWFYEFENGTGDTEESLSEAECYTISEDYYNKYTRKK